MNKESPKQIRQLWWKLFKICLSLAVLYLFVTLWIDFQDPLNSDKPSPTRSFIRDGQTYQPVTLNYLSDFPCADPLQQEGPAAPAKNRGGTMPLPGKIQALEGRRVAVRGYMMPMETDSRGELRNFILVKSRLNCCYGQQPKLNEWILASIPRGKSVDPIVDIPITVYGTLDVGDKLDTDGSSMGLYRLTVDGVDRPKKRFLFF